ncbi:MULTISPECIES: hypothetical protein [Thermus]|uniref:hypothetical protein n=1 Tax=Thermus TaxID=270 RepID=UPI000AB40EA6|nr:hypothetical protein [Thermus brockianus]
MSAKVDQEPERLEAAAPFLLAEVRALGELLPKYPRFKGEGGRSWKARPMPASRA